MTAIDAGQPRISVAMDSVRKVCQLTGEWDRERNEVAFNQTEARFGLFGTDLGSSFAARRAPLVSVRGHVAEHRPHRTIRTAWHGRRTRTRSRAFDLNLCKTAALIGHRGSATLRVRESARGSTRFQ